MPTVCSFATLGGSGRRMALWIMSGCGGEDKMANESGSLQRCDWSPIRIRQSTFIRELRPMSRMRLVVGKIRQAARTSRDSGSGNSISDGRGTANLLIAFRRCSA